MHTRSFRGNFDAGSDLALALFINGNPFAAFGSHAL